MLILVEVVKFSQNSPPLLSRKRESLESQSGASECRSTIVERAIPRQKFDGYKSFSCPLVKIQSVKTLSFLAQFSNDCRK